MDDWPRYDDYRIRIGPKPEVINPFIDIEEGRPLSSVELHEYQTRPYLVMQLISLLFVIACFITTYITLYFVIYLCDRLDNAKFIQF